MSRVGPLASSASTPNLAPMVDVVMVILIFFMLGTSFALSEGALPMQLPADVGPGGGASITITPVVRIAIRQTATPDAAVIHVMQRPLSPSSPEALFAFMRAKREQGADPRGRVVVSADPGVRYRHVISAFNACVLAGFENVQFAVRRAADEDSIDDGG